MKNRNGAKVALAAVGLGALTAYIIACRPAWSPDGTQLLFPYYWPETEEVGVALLDRPGGTVRSLYVGPGESEGFSFSMPSAQWAQGGGLALVSWAERIGDTDGTRLLLLPQPEGPVQTLFLPDVESQFGIPISESDGHLILFGEGLTRVHLASGEVVERKELPESETPILASAGNRVFYVMQLDGGYGFGTLNPETLEMTQALEMSEEQVGEIMPFMAVSGDGNRVAMPAYKEEQAGILVIADGKMERTFPVRLPGKECALGQMEWSPDGKRLFAAAAACSEEGGRPQIGVAEVDIESGSATMIPIAALEEDGDLDGEWFHFFQVAMAPDGNTLAVSTSCLEEDMLKTADRALYLVDLKGNERAVRKVSPPKPQRVPDAE